MIFQSFLISLMSNLVAQEFPNHSYRFQKYDLAQKLHCSQKRKYDAVPHLNRSLKFTILIINDTIMDTLYIDTVKFPLFYFLRGKIV